MQNISVDDNGDNPFNDMVLYDIVTQVRYICAKKIEGSTDQFLNVD